MKTDKYSIGIVLLLGAASFACSAVSNLIATPTPVPTSTPTPTHTPLPSPTATVALEPTQSAGGVLLDETEFGDASCFKQAQSDSKVQRFVDAGQFHINVKVGKLSAWEFCENVPFDDFIVDAQATPLNGPNSNGYGLILRAAGDEFYLFLVGADGYYSFLYYGVSADPDFIVEWTESTAIKQGNETNQLKVEAIGSDFKFYVNDQLVDEAQDDRLTSGNVGFFVLSSDETGLDVAFDNLKVSSP